MEYPAYSGPSERDKVMNFGPPEANLSPTEQNKVTKYSSVSGKYTGPPERDKVTNSGPPEINSGPPERDKVTNSGPPEINSGPPERYKVGSPGAKPGSLKWGKIMRRGA